MKCKPIILKIQSAQYCTYIPEWTIVQDDQKGIFLQSLLSISNNSMYSNLHHIYGWKKFVLDGFYIILNKLKKKLVSIGVKKWQKKWLFEEENSQIHVNTLKLGRFRKKWVRNTSSTTPLVLLAKPHYGILITIIWQKINKHQI